MSVWKVAYCISVIQEKFPYFTYSHCTGNLETARLPINTTSHIHLCKIPREPCSQVRSSNLFPLPFVSKMMQLDHWNWFFNQMWTARWPSLCEQIADQHFHFVKFRYTEKSSCPYGAVYAFRFSIIMYVFPFSECLTSCHVLSRITAKYFSLMILLLLWTNHLVWQCRNKIGMDSDNLCLTQKKKIMS